MSSRNMAKAGEVVSQREHEVDNSRVPAKIPKIKRIDQAMGEMHLTTVTKAGKDSGEVSSVNDMDRYQQGSASMSELTDQAMTLSQKKLATTTNTEQNLGASSQKELCLVCMPAEVISAILEMLGADDLGSARLLNKYIAAVGRRLLCVNVNVMESEESLNRLMTISSQNEEITQSVKHLTYIALKSEDEPWFAPFDAYSKAQQIMDPQYVKEASDEEKAKFWAGKKCLLEHQSLKVSCLEKAFKVLQPQSVAISLSRYDTIRYSHKLYQSLMKHEIRRSVLRGDCTGSFIAVLLTAESTGLRIKKLSARSGLGFLLHPNIEKIEKAYASVLDLNLILQTDPKPDPNDWGLEDETYDDQSKVRLAQFMGKAQDLQILTLGFLSQDCAWSPEKYLMLRDLYWPELKSLTIFRCSNLMVDLFSFILKHAKTLIKLDLQDLSFKFVSRKEKQLSFVEFLQFFLDNIQGGVLNLEAFTLLGNFRLEGESYFIHANEQLSIHASRAHEAEFRWAKTSKETLAKALATYIESLQEDIEREE